MVSPKQIRTDDIETAMGRFKKKQLELSQLSISDKQIKEMLRPKSIVERDLRVPILLRALTKYGEMPGPVVTKLTGTTGNTALSQTILGRMKDEGLIACRRGLFDGHICNIFFITLKGRKTLKKFGKGKK